MYLKNYLSNIKADPLAFIIGVSVTMVAVMGTSVQHVASTMFGLMVLLSFSEIKNFKKLYFSLSYLEKMFIFSLVLYAFSSLLPYYNTDDIDKFIRLLERYFRFMIVVLVYLFLIKRKLSVLNYLYVGAVVSGPFLFIVALNHSFINPGVPAKGYYHHIIFGQLAMLNVGVMMSILLTRAVSRWVQLLIFLSVLCGIATVLMSQARGVWLVFPVYIFIIVYYVIKDKKLNWIYITALFSIMSLLLLFTPAGEVVKKRSAAAVAEVSNYYTDGQYMSSVGTRLAMWDIAVDVWKRYPVFGTGIGDFDDEVMAVQEKGKYVGMDIHNSVHNIYIQALVGSGLVGLLVLLFTIILMPIRIFINMIRVDKGASHVGIITVISYAIFGLTESWTLRLPAVSVFLVYLVVIVSHLYVLQLNKNET